MMRQRLSRSQVHVSRMSRIEIVEANPELALVRLPLFAPKHVHAFVIRGAAGKVLFNPGPVLRDGICRAAGLEGAVLHLAKQVHGAHVHELPADPAGSGNTPSRGSLASSSAETPAPPEADALISSSAGHAVAVATADCLPILLAVPGGPCAAVHAGWKGLLGGVIEAAVQRLRDVEARTAPSPAHWPDLVPEGRPRFRMEAAIGPAIGPCCFEVGVEVADRFRERFPQSGALMRPPATPGKSLIDLAAGALSILQEVGLEGASIHTVGWCTRCGSLKTGDGGRGSSREKSARDEAQHGDSIPPGLHRLESYRRDGAAAGRMISLIAPPASLQSARL